VPRGPGEPKLFDPANEQSFWAKPQPFSDASGWLVSTADDVWRFARMLRDGGVASSKRVLSAGAVRQMTSDQLTAEQRAANEFLLGEGGSWGFGMAVPAGPQRGPMRGYGWNGGSGTSWYTDPASDLTGILLTQRAMTSPSPPEVFLDFWQAARTGLGE
jgi:CubicO group peptidase (beta-lactamase class C family)